MMSSSLFEGFNVGIHNVAMRDRKGKIHNREDLILKSGLDRWRSLKLQKLEILMLELTEDFHSAHEGLGIAHRNPGEVASDIIKYLWEKLERCATELADLESQHANLLNMELPELIVTFKRERLKGSWALRSF